MVMTVLFLMIIRLIIVRMSFIENDNYYDYLCDNYSVHTNDSVVVKLNFADGCNDGDEACDDDKL